MTNDIIRESREAREKYADQLLEFNTQRSWYSSRAGNFKNRAQRLDMLIILAGALVSALPAISKFMAGTFEHFIDIGLVVLGVTIVVSQGMQRVFRYAEIWPEYRLASERMKREWRLFVNSAPPYDTDDEIAKCAYVGRLDAIMADEQKIFFERQREESQAEREAQ